MSKMKITICELRKMFTDLIEENQNREYFSEIAATLLQANDSDQLEYEPLKEKEKMWLGIKYLSRVDARDMEGNYLRSISDLINFTKKLHL